MLRKLMLLGLGCIAPAIPMRATTVVAPEFSELVNQSDCIVRAVVKSVRAEVQQTGHGHKIYTYVELDVREVIAGTPPSPLVLRILGGKVGREEMIIQGAPQFNVGDEDILFVQGNGQQIYPLVAMMHGRYPIQHDPGTGRAFVARSNRAPLHNTAEVSRPMTETNAAPTSGLLSSPVPAMSPDDFVQQIRAAVKSSNTRLLEN